ncbi:conserved hypothetical protein [Talaromyces stipitatus ATCC 10500]|uniref:Uncharacterized protein n=1 Tax=Talaromyces stipitatus (strain ATCC 10500 / CBS 375.48 / QM 6759 / NRRL 1006) TaxID=441959 RepID=B8MKQ4_TALSN|nr:uncharacterized protein TSTA_043740 [Talaromyces stipitatus ATCC 10500]EED14903.1 conserved hypothetical protein [Talaromyces stipitatus ATCC 10500]
MGEKKSAVNRPMNPQQRDADISTKLQLYGIYSAFANGKLPSNKQCDVALNSAIKSKWLSSPSKELSEDGRTLVKDLRDVIDKTKLLFLTKNEGELLQEFIWDAQQITGEEFRGASGPVNKESASQDADRAAEGFKTLGTLLITNGEFRKLLSDAVVLLRDIAGDAASKAATKLRPDENALSQIDQPAEENVWYEKPDINKDALKAQFKEQTDRLKPAANAATSSATGGREDAPVSEIDARAGASAVKETLQQSAERNVPPEDREQAQRIRDQAQAVSSEYSNRTKEFLASKMPPERRDQVVWRLKKMIVEIQGHSNYQQAIETLLSLAETYAGHGKDLTSQGSTAAKGARENIIIRKAETNLRILIERFANSTSTDDFFDSLNTVYRDADQDPRLKDWFKNVDTYIRKCLREQGFIMQDAATEQWNKLYDEGRFLLRDRYRSHTDRIADEAKFLATQFDEDPQNRAFRQSLEKLFKDLGQDQYGKPVFKPQLIKDITNVIIPEIFENASYIPIPRIEVSDRAVDMVIENLIIESDNLMPNVVEFGADNYWRWGRKMISNIDDHKIMISASGIQADLRDVNYYLKRKQGFPLLTDTGVMDILLGGTGFGFKIAASKAQKNDRNAIFKLDSVKINIKNLSLNLKKSNHKILFTIFRPMLLNVVRPAIEKVLESQIREAFQKADAFAYQVQKEAQRAQDAIREDPENAKNIFARYADAARQVITEKKKQAETIAQRGPKVNLAMTHQDAMLKDIKLLGGVTTKATEYKELSAKGDRWQSPVFNWGSSSPTNNLPKPAEVTRKPHTTAESRLQERPTADGAGTDGSGVNGFHHTGATNGANGHALSPADGVSAHGTNGTFKKEVDRAFDANAAPAPTLDGI